MRILFWTDSFPNYSETFIRNQITNLLDKGVYVYIYTDKKENDNIKSIDYLGNYNLLNRVIGKEDIIPEKKIKRVLKAIVILFFSIFSLKTHYYLRSLNFCNLGNKAKTLRYFYFVHFLIKNKINVIHAHYGTNGNKVVFLKKIKFPIKIFCTFHGYDIRIGEVNDNSFYADLFKYVDNIISISNFNRIKLLSFGLNKEKIIEINNGVKVFEISSQSKFKVNKVIKILSVGRLVEEKAYHLALTALSKLKKKFPAVLFKYDIIGDGVLKKKLEVLVNKLNLNDIVHFYLSQNSIFVSDLMKQSDFLLITSVKESLPTVILESFAVGLPVLATNVGSINEVVINNKTGVLVSPTHKNVYEGLLFMINNRVNWHIFGRNGNKLVFEKYNEDIQIKKLIELYSNSSSITTT